MSGNKGFYEDMSIHSWAVGERDGKRYILLELEYFEGIDEITIEIDFDDFASMVAELINTGYIDTEVANDGL